MSNTPLVDKHIVLKRSFDRLFTTGNEFGAYIELGQNSWKEIIFELFKNILENPKTQELKTIEKIDNSNISSLIPTILQPAIDKTNTHIKNVLIPNITRSAVNSGYLSEEAPDYFDLDSDVGTERVINPRARDLLPKLRVAAHTFGEEECIKACHGIEFPYEKMPFITMYPSIQNMFTFDKMYSTYRDEYTNNNYYSNILEISATSLLFDSMELLSNVEYIGGDYKLHPQGENVFREIIDKYTAFIMPLIGILLKSDFKNTLEFSTDLYNNFISRFPIDISFQRHTFVIIDLLMKSPIGLYLAYATSMKRLVSTLQFVFRTKESKELAEHYLISGGVTNCFTHLERIEDISDVIRESFKNAFTHEIDGLKKFSNTIRAEILKSVIDIYWNSDDNTDIKLSSLHKLVSSKLTNFGVNEYSSYDKIKMLGTNCIPSLDVIMSLKNKIEKTLKTNYREIMNADDEIILRRKQLISNTNMVYEDGSILIEISALGYSGRAIHWLKNRFDNAVSFEECASICLDCSNYAEFAKKSRLNTEKKSEFSTFLSNISHLATEKMHEIAFSNGIE